MDTGAWQSERKQLLEVENATRIKLEELQELQKEQMDVRLKKESEDKQHEMLTQEISLMRQQREYQIMGQGIQGLGQGGDGAADVVDPLGAISIGLVAAAARI